jgi:DNA-binding CsgD family transcriptional regulator
VTIPGHVPGDQTVDGALARAGPRPARQRAEQGLTSCPRTSEPARWCGRLCGPIFPAGGPEAVRGHRPPTPHLEVGPAELTVQASLLSPQTRLSRPEREVLGYLATMAAEDIATRLEVSVQTVKAHLKSTYRKLGVSRRRDAVTEAIKRGLL